MPVAAHSPTEAAPGIRTIDLRRDLTAAVPSSPGLVGHPDDLLQLNGGARVKEVAAAPPGPPAARKRDRAPKPVRHTER